MRIKGSIAAVSLATAIFVGTACEQQPPYSSSSPLPGTHKASATPRLTPSASPSPSSRVLPARRDPRYWPFARRSVWNRPIGSRAKYQPRGSARSCSYDISGAGGNFIQVNFNTTSYSQSVAVARLSDPLMGLYLDGTLVRRARVPADARPSFGRDAVMNVITPNGRYADESWHTVKYADGWDADGRWRYDLYGSGIGLGGTAAGTSHLGGLIREGELSAGIHHALQASLAPDLQKPGYVWPASQQDEWMERNPPPGNVAEGSLAAIPPRFEIESLGLQTEQGLEVARAMQDYGVYDVNTGTDVAGLTLYGERSVRNDADASAGSMFRQDLDKIHSYLRCVTNNSRTSVGGGGKPRVPLAPPFVRPYTKK